MKNLRKPFSVLLVAVMSFFAMTSCEEELTLSDEMQMTDGSHGVLHLYLTDAPMDELDLTGVFIRVNEIQIHMSGTDEWLSPESFEGPQTYNLLELTHGLSELMASVELPAGTYNQIRFLLEAPEGEPGENGRGNRGNHYNPGCYLEFADGSTLPLFVPSGSNTGFKAVGAFHVPENGEVSVTADFDVRRSVVQAGRSGRYILKPTIRLVVNDQAGNISGTVSNLADGTGAVVYAYEAGTYTNDEAADPEVEAARFPNAISSDMVREAGCFRISFLAPGNYDLVVTSTVDGAFSRVLGLVGDVEVQSRESTQVNIDVNAL